MITKPFLLAELQLLILQSRIGLQRRREQITIVSKRVLLCGYPSINIETGLGRLEGQLDLAADFRNVTLDNRIDRHIRNHRLDDGAPSLDMIAAARRAARSTSTDTLVFSARTPTGRAVPLWDELRTWDPGD